MSVPATYRPDPPPTEKQVRFLSSLLAKKAHASWNDINHVPMTSKVVSGFIDRLIAAKTVKDGMNEVEAFLSIHGKTAPPIPKPTAIPPPPATPPRYSPGAGATRRPKIPLSAGSTVGGNGHDSHVYAKETPMNLAGQEAAMKLATMLIRRFPDGGFSVSAEKGRPDNVVALNVEWENGPTMDAVQRVSEEFAGNDPSILVSIHRSVRISPEGRLRSVIETATGRPFSEDGRYTAEDMAKVDTMFSEAGMLRGAVLLDAYRKIPEKQV